MKERDTLPTWWNGIAALSEVFAVFLGGRVISILLVGAIGLSSSKELIAAVPEGNAPDFLAMAGTTTLELFLRYGIMFGLAFAVGWWHRRRPLARYGVTLAGTPASRQVGTGVLLFAVVGLFPALLMLLQNHISIGEGADHWTIFSYEWNLGFWVFMFVSSFGLVPIFEELFTRGYFQMRLTEDLGAGSAILITAVVFAFSHTQYYKLELLSLGILFSIVLSSIIGGYVFYRTGSLVPVIIAHAIGNVPWRGAFDFAVPALSILLIIVFRREIAGTARHLFAEFGYSTSLIHVAAGAVVMAGVVVTLMTVQNLLAVWGIVAMVISTIFLVREKRFRRVSGHEGSDQQV